MTLDNISASDCPTMGIKDPVRNFAVLSPRVSAVLKTAVLSVRIPKKTVARSDMENMTVFFIMVSRKSVYGFRLMQLIFYPSDK